MSVGFGFSIGDFIAVCKLAVDTAKALDEIHGASSDFKALSQVLHSLTRAIHSASAVFFYPSSTDHSSLNGVAHELGCCKRLIDGFLESIEKYTESLLKTRPGWRVRDEWRKVKWSYRTEDVRVLRENLMGHLGAFQVYAFTITWWVFYFR